MARPRLLCTQAQPATARMSIAIGMVTRVTPVIAVQNSAIRQGLSIMGWGSAFLPGARNGSAIDRHERTLTAAANYCREQGSMPQRCSSVLISTRATVTP
jgi:hypothetical protein